MKILFVDDMKQPKHFGLPEQNTPHAYNAEDALRMWEKFGPYDELYLDHDLSEDGMNGYQLLKALAIAGTPPKKVLCISYNVVGAQNIEALCKEYGIPYERRMM
jgi:CheY-like chemotaxis protein